jgi:hypothetical protein
MGHIRRFILVITSTETAHKRQRDKENWQILCSRSDDDVGSQVDINVLRNARATWRHSSAEQRRYCALTDRITQESQAGSTEREAESLSRRTSGLLCQQTFTGHTVATTH